MERVVSECSQHGLVSALYVYNMVSSYITCVQSLDNMVSSYITRVQSLDNMVSSHITRVQSLDNTETGVVLV